MLTAGSPLVRSRASHSFGSPASADAATKMVPAVDERKRERESDRMVAEGDSIPGSFSDREVADDARKRSPTRPRLRKESGRSFVIMAAKMNQPHRERAGTKKPGGRRALTARSVRALPMHSDKQLD